MKPNPLTLSERSESKGQRKWMPSRFALAFGLVLSCAEPDGPPYSYNDTRLLTGYTAKEACSCLWVMEQTEDYCRAWVVANPPLGRFTIDWNQKIVTSSAAVLWSAQAKYVDDVVGCQLEQ
jgi:hypothetical protein